MIELKKGSVKLEGPLGELIIEAARILDAVADTIAKNVPEEEIDYNFIMEEILTYVAQISKLDPVSNLWGEEEEISFFHDIQKLRRNLKRDNISKEDIIDYDSGAQEPKEGKNSYGKKLKDTTSISGGIKLNGHEDFFIDPRISQEDLIDINDLKKKNKRK